MYRLYVHILRISSCTFSCPIFCSLKILHVHVLGTAKNMYILEEEDEIGEEEKEDEKWQRNGQGIGKEREKGRGRGIGIGRWNRRGRQEGWEKEKK